VDHPSIAERLSGGDRRSLTAIDAVTSDVLRHNDRFGELFDTMLHEDPVVRARAAGAVERITRARPDLLVPFRKRLIAEAGEIEQPDVRRHVAHMLPRVRLDLKDRSKAIALLERYLESTEETVVVAAMSAIGDFAVDDAPLRRRLTPTIERLAASRVPAVEARGKSVLGRFASVDAKALIKKRR